MVKTVQRKWMRIIDIFPFVYALYGFATWYAFENYDFTLFGDQTYLTWVLCIVPIAYVTLIAPFLKQRFSYAAVYTVGIALSFMPIAGSIGATGEFESVHYYWWALLIAVSALLGYMLPLILAGLGWLNYFLIAINRITEVNQGARNLPSIDLTHAPYVLLGLSVVAALSVAWIRRYYVQEDHEITKLRNALHEERIQSEAVLAHIDSGIVIFDKLGIVRHSNRFMQEVLQKDAEQAVGKSYSALFKGVQLQNMVEMGQTLSGLLRSTMTGDTPQSIDFATIRRQDGSTADVTLYCTPLRSVEGDITSYCLIVHDISNLADVRRMKDEFISIASHELRTPMTIIAGYADLLLRADKDTPLTEAQREKIQRIKTSTVRLIDLVNDMLDLSRLESGMVEEKVSKISVPQFVRAVVSDMHEHFKTKDITLIADAIPEKTVTVSEQHMRRVLTNLLSNAYKFTPEGGHVEVTGKVEGGVIELSVKDDGPGLSKKQQNTIFEKFSRAKGHEAIEGTGLGLAICRQIVSEWDGDIGVESKEGEGARFYFTVPVSRSLKRKKEGDNNENNDN